jgi:predicted DNA binding CopG/RHH family protein
MKSVPIRLEESEHRGLKILAVKKGTSIQQLLIMALDKAFPGWREEHKK